MFRKKQLLSKTIKSQPAACVAIALMFLSPVSAHARGDIYVGLGGQYSMASFEMDLTTSRRPGQTFVTHAIAAPEFGYDIVAGYQFAPRWRAELNYGYAGKYKDNLTDGRWAMDVQYLMANALYRLWTLDEWSVHLGPGLGAAMVHAHMDSLDIAGTTTKLRIAGHLLIGLEYRATDWLAIVGQFRTMYGGGVSEHYRFNSGATMDAQTKPILTNSLMLGVRVMF
jgi:opacity protein-like surface antigen